LTLYHRQWLCQALVAERPRVRSRLREGSAAMTRAEAFRIKAAECDKKADQVTDVEAKRLFREAADNWLSMAIQAERFGEW
jgi:hypothetical protein